ncbi:MAG: glycosyltransferase family 39 protein [Chloroflexota bacterium]|nr:glycosyltransferase family 39 protein [Chloroflexota bacterium]
MADAHAVGSTTARIAAAPPFESRPAAASKLPLLASAERRLANGRLVDWLVVLLIAAYIVAMLSGLTHWPPPINDEGREANLFWIASGADPAAERMNAHRGFPTWGNGGLQGFTAAVIFRLAGLGVFQARLTSLLWGGLLLLVVYWLGRRYWNRAVGLAAVAMLAVADPFLVSTHTLRPDIQVVTMVLGALLLAEKAVDRAGAPARADVAQHASSLPRLLVGSVTFAFASGLLLGLVVDTHPNGLAFFPLVGLMFLLRQGIGCFRRPEVWVFALGIVAAALYYLAVRFLPDPAGFMAAMGYWLGVDKAPPVARGGGAGGLFGLLGNEVGRYVDYFGEEPLELALVLLGLGGGLWMAVRGSYPARLFWLGLLFAFAFFVVAVSMKSKYYMLLTYPIYLLLAARVLERAAAWVGERLGPWLDGRVARTPPPESPPAFGGLHGGTLVAGGVLAALVIGAMLWPLRAEERAWDNYIRARRYREGQDLTRLTAQLDRLAGPDAKILAPPVYWLGLHDHPFVDIYVYERLERQYGMTPAQFLAETRPDFVITDAKIATEKRVEKLLYTELDARAERQMIVRHKNFGDVAVYRLTW